MEIRVHGPGQEPEPLVVTMRTPGNEFDLAVGFCITEGVIDSASDVATVAYCLPEDGISHLDRDDTNWHFWERWFDMLTSDEV